MDFSRFLSMCDQQFQSGVQINHNSTSAHKEIYKAAGAEIGNIKELQAISLLFLKKIAIAQDNGDIKATKYIPVLKSILEAGRRALDTKPDATHETQWESLIKIIIENSQGLINFKHDKQKELDESFRIFAYAHNRLSNIGVKFVERNHEIYISEESYSLIDREIDALCRSYGGDNLILSISEILGKTYNSVTGRFMEYRHVSMGLTKVSPAIPFGYLIAISSKHIGTKGDRNPASLEKLISVITYLIAVFEIQPHNAYETMYLANEHILEFIYKNVLYDGFVGTAQTKASFASSLIKFTQDKFSDEKYSSHGIKIKDLSRIATALISLSNTKRFANLRLKDIAKKSGLSEHKVALAMDKLLSVAAGESNSELRFPPKSLEIDHYFKPAIKIGKNYKIFPKSIAALGSLNTVFNAISRPNDKWSNPDDSALGYVVEDYVREEFLKKDISFVYGERCDGGVALEADLICETSDAIYIFEMKKKGLTREAQSGNTAKILADLSDSVLASHSQAMGIESALLNSSSLTLQQRDGIQKSISLNDRTVYRISLSLHDFGVLQDKTFLQRVLTFAATTEVSLDDSKKDKELRRWREYSEQIQNFATESGELTGDKGVAFHRSLFMSIPQVMLILDHSNTTEEFFKYIRLLITMTTFSRNTYAEFIHSYEMLRRTD
ncbi:MULTISPECIES: hypothetical protein [Pseudomonas]|uniref:hypothetical protein n=1 Tax=Pseudomonas nitroreducens TaxID=46680 RepID=UPI001E2DF0F6|nr:MULTISPECIES: hypothetical protein [Pseudomonas]MCE4069663.1 hypothetical protein [Pseudomonas nitritireducens]MCE4079174.1 hypothetical protein [Pseudomonas nitroreducens]